MSRPIASNDNGKLQRPRLTNLWAHDAATVDAMERATNIAIDCGWISVERAMAATWHWYLQANKRLPKRTLAEWLSTLQRWNGRNFFGCETWTHHAHFGNIEERVQVRIYGTRSRRRVHVDIVETLVTREGEQEHALVILEAAGIAKDDLQRAVTYIERHPLVFNLHFRAFSDRSRFDWYVVLLLVLNQRLDVSLDGIAEYDGSMDHHWRLIEGGAS